MDNQRHAHFLKPLADIVPNTKFFTPEEKQKYKYEPYVKSKAKKLSDMIPQPEEQKRFTTEAIAKFRDFIQH